MEYWLINTLIMILVLLIVRSGFRGDTALIKTGGWTLPLLVIIGVPYVHGWGGAIFWVVALFVGYGITIIAADKSQKNPYVFKSDEDSFSASFPKKPTVESSFGGSRYSAQSGGVGYMVAVTHDSLDADVLNDKAANILQRTLLQRELDSLQDGRKREIVSTDNDSNYLGWPSANVIYQQPGYLTVARYFRVGDRVFHILVAHRRKDIAELEFERFIEGFKLIDNT